jgi:hypothetical protein
LVSEYVLGQCPSGSTQMRGYGVLLPDSVL